MSIPSTVSFVSITLQKCLECIGIAVNVSDEIVHIVCSNKVCHLVDWVMAGLPMEAALRSSARPGQTDSEE